MHATGCLIRLGFQMHRLSIPILFKKQIFTCSKNLVTRTIDYYDHLLVSLTTIDEYMIKLICLIKKCDKIAPDIEIEIISRAPRCPVGVHSRIFLVKSMTMLVLAHYKDVT